MMSQMAGSAPSSTPTNTCMPNGSTGAICLRPAATTSQVTSSGESTSCSPARRMLFAKSPLAERPIWHHLEQRTDTHIFLCVLAYHLLISIEKTLLDNGVHTSWATVRDILKTHQICTVVLPTDDGSCLRIRKAATPHPD